MTTTRRETVVGCGSESAGDDSLGLELVRRAARSAASKRTYRLMPSAPADLVEMFRETDSIIFIAAVRSGEAPGTIHLIKSDAEHPAFGNLPGDGCRINDAVDLAQRLGRSVPGLSLLAIAADAEARGSRVSAAGERAIDFCLEHFDELCELAGSSCQSTTICFSTDRELVHA